MKLRYFVPLLLALCLAGCSYQALPQETKQSEPSATIIPTDISTVPQPTQPQATAPTPGETTPTQVIVQPEPSDEDFVKVITYIPDMIQELRYGTENNFTGQKIYVFADIWLRYGTVKKLILVQEELRQMGLGLKIWDGFRPPSAQFRLWEICPDPVYVSNPNNGFSSHSRGNTVDLTLVYAGGTELVMPTGFDDFSKLADRDYSDCSAEAAENALLLENLMIKHGFKPYSGEWWHFSDTNTYPVDELFEPVKETMYFADCNEYISLRLKPNAASDVLTKIPAGEVFSVLAQYGDFALVEYRGLLGYVLKAYMQRVS